MKTIGVDKDKEAIKGLTEDSMGKADKALVGKVDKALVGKVVSMGAIMDKVALAGEDTILTPTSNQSTTQITILIHIQASKHHLR